MTKSGRQDVDDRICKFADSVREMNRRVKDTTVLVSLVVFLMALANVSYLCLDYEALALGDWVQVLRPLGFEVAGVLIYTMMFFRGYLKIQGKNGAISQDLTDCVVMMPFSLEEYFSFLKVKMWKFMRWIVLLVAIVVVLGGVLVGTVACVVACVLSCGVCVLTTEACYYGEKCSVFRKLQRRGIHKESRKKESKLRKKLAKGLWRFDKVIDVCVLLGLLYGFASGMILTFRIMDDTREMHYNSYSNHYLIFLFFVFTFLSLISSQLRSDEEMKKGYLFAGIGGLLACFLCYQGIYTIYYEDTIESCFFFQKTEYTLSQVDSYVVEKRGILGDIGLELTIGDKKFSVLTSNASFSDVYFDRYDTNFEYVAAYVKRLNELGISGTVEDVEKLEKLAGKQDDSDAARKMLEEIEEMSGGV
jgi:hypothetical protein